MSGGDLEIRAARPEDEPGLLDLFRAVFRHRRDSRRWRWQYRDTAKGPGWSSVAVDGDRIVGHHGLMRQHLGHLGVEIVAGQECDAMVAEDFRGRGLYSRLAAHSYESAVADGLTAVVSVPSRNSFPGSYPLLTRRLGYRRVANLSGYTRRIGYRRPLGGAIDSAAKLISRPLLAGALRLATLAAGADLRVSVERSLPDDLEEALQQIRSYEVLAVWRDSTYLRWRYERHPEHEYRFFVARGRTGAEGVVIARVSDRSIVICDVLHRRKDPARTAVILRAVARHFGPSRAQRIEFQGLDNGFFQAAFLAAGFRRQPFGRVILVARSEGGGRLAEDVALSQNWTFVSGDTDAP